jgi:hypothetical protein
VLRQAHFLYNETAKYILRNSYLSSFPSLTACSIVYFECKYPITEFTFFINEPYSFIFKIKFYVVKSFISFFRSKNTLYFRGISPNFGFSHKSSTDINIIMESICIYDGRKNRTIMKLHNYHSQFASFSKDNISFIYFFFFPMARQPLGGPGRHTVRGFTTTLGRTPLDEGPARRRDLYLTTHNIHKRQISMPSAEFEPTILVSERPQTHALDRAATAIGRQYC